MAVWRFWPALSQRAVHDLSHLAELSDEPINARLLSDRSLYILQNLAASEVQLSSRYAVELGEHGYFMVDTEDAEYSDFLTAANLVALELMDEVSMYYPRDDTFWADEAQVLLGSALYKGLFPNQQYSILCSQSPFANGDERFNYVYLAEGIYELHLLGYTGSNWGKVDWYRGADVIATGQDWYSAAATYNVEKVIADVEIPYSGYHPIKSKVNGKNPSSGGYFLTLTKGWFEWQGQIGG